MCEMDIGNVDNPNLSVFCQYSNVNLDGRVYECLPTSISAVLAEDVLYLVPVYGSSE